MSDTQFDLEYFFDLSPDLLCITGFDGYFKKINPAVANALGFSKEELLSTPIVNFVHPNDKEITVKKMEELKQGTVVFQFENRFLARNGAVVWLWWTAVPIDKDQLIFGIAKDISQQKRLEDSERVSGMLSKLNTDQMKRFSEEIDLIQPVIQTDGSNLKWMGTTDSLNPKDQAWLNKFETLIRHYAPTYNISLVTLSSDMAISERQLFRQVNRLMGITPNKLIKIIRLHLAWEAIASRKFHTLTEVAAQAGYVSVSHFKKLFNQVYGIDVSDLL